MSSPLKAAVAIDLLLYLKLWNVLSLPVLASLFMQSAGGGPKNGSLHIVPPLARAAAPPSPILLAEIQYYKIVSKC